MQRNLLVHGRGLKHINALCNLGIQTTMVLNQLGIDTIVSQTPLLLPLLVVFSGVLGETPTTACSYQQASQGVTKPGAALSRDVLKVLYLIWVQAAHTQKVMHNTYTNKKHGSMRCKSLTMQQEGDGQDYW